MNTLQRSLTYLVRNLKKTFLLFILVALTGSLLMGAFSMDGAIQLTRRSIRSTIPAVLTLELSIDRLLEMGDVELSPLTWDTVWELENLPFVSYMENVIVGHFHSNDIRPVSLETDIFPPTPFLEDYYSFRATGVNSLNLALLDLGIIEIYRGRFFSPEEIASTGLNSYAFISKAFAQENQLSIGSTFSLYNRAFDLRNFGGMTRDNMVAEEVFSLEVVGIFQHVQPLSTGVEGQDEFFQRELLNMIYVPFDVAFASNRLFWLYSGLTEEEDIPRLINQEQLMSNFRFFLRDPYYLESFHQKAEQILPPQFEVMDLSPVYGSLTTALDNLSDISGFITVTAMLSFVLIMILLLFLYLSDRKGEIGIYLSLGERKLNVILQLITEVLLPCSAALILSIAVGNIVADNLSQQMVRNEIMNQQEILARDRLNYHPLHGVNDLGTELLAFLSPGDLTEAEMMSHFQVELDARTTVAFLGVSFILIVVSLSIPLVYITRLDVKKILL